MRRTETNSQNDRILPHSVLTWLGVFVGALSVFSLFQYGFNYGLGPTLARMLEYYDRLISIPASWVEPQINAGLTLLSSMMDWHLELFPHWKHIFVLLSIYFFRMAAHGFHLGLLGTGIFRALWGLLVALTIGISAGIVEANRSNLEAAFLIAAVPILGVFIFELGFNLWNAIVLRSRTAHIRRLPVTSWWSEFSRCSVLDLWRNSVALILLWIGLQVPIVQDLPSPGLAMLGGLIVALGFYWIWSGTRMANSIRNEGEHWRTAFWRTGNPRIGAAMLGVFVLMGIFLLLNAGLDIFGL